MASASKEPRREDYDVALSYAGEQGEYVREVAECLIEHDVRLFYDKDRATKIELWGKDLAEHFDIVFRKRSRFCVMFVSKEYRDKMWTTHERRSAIAKSIEQGGEYILPVRFDAVDLDGIPDTVAYLDAKDTSPKELCDMIVQKIRGRETSSVRGIVANKMKAIRRSSEANQRRDQFRHSEEGVAEAMTSARLVFESLIELGEEHRHESSGFGFASERKNEGTLRERFRMYAVGLTIQLQLYVPFKNSIQGFDMYDDAHLRIRLFSGVVRNGWISDETPAVVAERRCDFDTDGEGDVGWRLERAGELIPPEEVANREFLAFVEYAEAHRNT